MAVRGAQIPRNYYRRSADLINGDAEIFSADNKLDNKILIKNCLAIKLKYYFDRE
tara:strand:- start:55 stop:219 length:165 start_codon:yes stop_codon:yes gene_type:complete